VIPDIEVFERFWSKVDTSGECWIWKASVSARYGCIHINKRNRRAHRVAWELTKGPIPEGHAVCHKCDNPLCVRPSHLFTGTQADNVADCVAKGRFPNLFKKGNIPLHRGGKPSPNRKFTMDAVREMRALSAAGMSYHRIAAKFRAHHTTVRHAIIGRWYRCDGEASS